MLTICSVMRSLGMDATSFFLSELQGREELRFAAPRGQPEPGGHYEVAEYPAAQVRSTAADLCRWLSFLTRPELEPEPEPGPPGPGPGPGPAQRILSRESIEAMLPSSGSGSLAWWGMDAQYSEKRRGQFEHGGFMQGIRSKQDTERLLDLRASMPRVLNCGVVHFAAHIYLWPRSPSASHACGCVVLLNGEGDYAGVVDAIKALPAISKL